MGKLQLLTRDPGTVVHSRTTKATKKQRLTVQYTFDHRTVCQSAFCFLHGIGLFTLRALKKHITEVGPCTREHGSKGRMAHNAHPFEVVCAAAEFIKNYASVFGLPQPAAARGRANQAPTYLPTNQNYKTVHAKYRSACMEEARPFMQYRSSMWKLCIPHIVFMTPETDVCHFCEDFRTAIQRAVCDDNKKALLAEFQTHLEEAQKERDASLAAIEKSKLALAANTEQPTYAHITFDFAQQALLPYHSRQVGPLYYKVSMRVQIFGICNNAIPSQINYLYDERETVGVNGSKSHGPNSVISMLHHFLQIYGKQ